MVRGVAWGSASSSDQPKEICIRGVVNDAGRSRESPALDMKVGKLAKKLMLTENPDFVFPKKTIYANGQQVSANVWLESQRGYIDAALAQL